MNQKDYKAISEIIKEVLGNNPILETYLLGISKRLADYFEREEKEKDEKVRDGNFIPLHKNEDDYFNRKQFLKDCGVE